MTAELLIVVTMESSAPYLSPLLAAANRADVSAAVFLTNDGVKLASENALGKTLACLETAVVCAESWAAYLPDESCPVTSGSQTNHSQLLAEARVVISL